jgi:tetratricopeptide (TPR) repeat protein
MMQGKTPFVFFILFLFAAQLRATPDIRPGATISEAFQKVMQLKLEEAEEILTVQSIRDSDKCLAVYLLNYADFLRVFNSGDPAEWERYKQSSFSRLKQISQIAGSQYFYYSLWNIHLQDAILRIKFGESVRAARSFYRFQRSLQEGIRAYPDFFLNLQGIAFHEILTGLVPEGYSSLVRLLGIQGSLDRGLQALDMYASLVSRMPGFREEASLLRWLMKIYVQGRAEEVVREIEGTEEFLNMKSPGTVIYAIASMKSGQSEKALIVLEAYQPAAGEQEIHLMQLLYGEALLYKGSQKASSHLQEFLKSYKGQDYRKVAWHKLAMHYYLLGEQDLMEISIEGLLREGALLTDPDRQAYSEGRKLRDYHPVLLRSRLKFDGGYYQEAMEVLQEFAPEDEQQQTEFHYRMARIYHRMGDEDMAIAQYMRVIEEGNALKNYFPAYSSLQLATIYRDRNQKERAVEFYHMALRLNRGEYKRTIDWEVNRNLRQLTRDM